MRAMTVVVTSGPGQAAIDVVGTRGSGVAGLPPQAGLYTLHGHNGGLQCKPVHGSFYS